MESVGFKEWALVCEALGRGDQTILLRKGGIAEGRGGFQFQHSEFFLFPTFFHEQVVKVRTPNPEVPAAVEGEVHIRYFARIARQKEINSWTAAAALEPFHVLRESVVRERFEYKGAGLQVALVRVFRLEPGWKLPYRPAYGGCRSWVKLPAPALGIRFEPVLGDQHFAKAAARLEAAVFGRDGALRRP